MATSQFPATGYGPSHNASRYQHLHFYGDERKYEMWETRLLGYMLMKGLKDTIDPKPGPDGQVSPADDTKNEQAYAELILWLDEKSLSLVVRDARDNGREALKLLRAHYRGKGKQRVIRLYTELTSLLMKQNESVTDYILRAENAATGLREAGEDISDGLLVAMVLKGLPPPFQSFVAVVTQSDRDWSFKDLKSNLRDYEDTEKARSAGNNLNPIMRCQMRGGMRGGKKGGKSRDTSKLTCHSCGELGHISPKCPNKTKNKNPKPGQGGAAGGGSAKQAASDEFHTFHFKADSEVVSEGEVEGESSKAVSASVSTAAVSKNNSGDPIVDSGCNQHISINEESFISFDETFTPEKHTIELADGRRYSNVAEKKGTAVINMVDSNGNVHEATLDNCLYIPSYPENIFSVKAANLKGSR